MLKLVLPALSFLDGSPDRKPGQGTGPDALLAGVSCSYNRQLSAGTSHEVCFRMFVRFGPVLFCFHVRKRQLERGETVRPAFILVVVVNRTSFAFVESEGSGF